MIATLSALPAFSADCPQAQAIYRDLTGAYEIRFEPVGSPSAVTSNQFKMKLEKAGLVLDGIVMQAGDPVRADGMILHDCPDGDSTGEDIRACTIWEGVIYAVGRDGTVGSLPDEKAAAAAQVLLPDLGPAIRNSVVWGKAKIAPWDALSFKGCAR